MATTAPPESPDDGKNIFHQLVQEAFEEMQRRLWFLDTSQEKNLEPLLEKLADEIVWEIRKRNDLTLPPPLHALWVSRLVAYGLAQVFARPPAALPLGVSYTPLLIGTDEHGKETYLPYTSRTSGLFASGQTGYGKTSFVENIIVGDITNGHGVFVVDPQGELIEHIHRRIPQERIPDVVLLRPGKQTWKIGFNLLENTSAGIAVDVNRAVDLFEKLWGYDSATPSWGARMSNLLKMSLHVLYKNSLPLSELTLFLETQTLRIRLVKALAHEGPDYYVREFFTYFESQLKKDRESWIAPIQNKIYELMRSEEMLAILSQEKTTLQALQHMDNRKIVLLHLDKSLVGGMDNVRLIGTVIIAEFMRAAFSRKAGDKTNPYFTIAVDEFELFVSSEFQTALSEIRKYGVGLILSNQVLDQLGKLRPLVEQLACQTTFRSIVEDANKRAPLYIGIPKSLTREQAKKVVVTNPITFILSGTHAYSNKRVLQWIQSTFRNLNLREWRHCLMPFDRHFYNVMTGDATSPNPFLPPPWPEYPFVGNPILEPTENILLKDEHPELFTDFPKNTYAPLYWLHHKNQCDAAIKEQEKEAAQEELIRIMARWAFLFAVQSEDDLQHSFALWETEARTMLREEMLCVAEAFLLRFNMSIPFAVKDIDWSKLPEKMSHEDPGWSYEYEKNRDQIFTDLLQKRREEDNEQYRISQRGTPDYEEKRQQQFEQAWERIEQEQAVEALGFPCDIQTLRSLLTLTRLQWHVTYVEGGKHPTREYEVSLTPGLVKNKYYYSSPCDRWTVMERQEEVLLPFIEPAIEQAVLEAKPLFEAHIRLLRDMQQALSDVPIAVTTSEMETVEYGKQSRYDMEKEAADRIINLPKYHCLIRFGESEDAEKPLVTVTKPDEGCSESELQTRLTVVEEISQQYGSDPTAIEKATRARRARIGIGSPLDLPTTFQTSTKPETEKKATGTNERKEAAQTSTKKATNETLQSLVFDDNYLHLLYHWFFLSQGQIKRLLSKKPTDTHVSERMKKLVKDGLIQETEWKTPGKRGKPEKIYSLTDIGLHQVELEFVLKSGSRKMPVSEHTLLVNDALITLCLLPVAAKNITLVSMLHELYFKSHSFKLPEGKGLEPDGFIQYRYGSGETHSIYIEVDRSFEGKSVWMDKCKKYIQALENGLLGEDPLTIAVHNTDGSMQNLLKWTQDLLTGHESYALLFAFTEKPPLDLTPLEYCTGSHWMQPFSSTPTGLLKTSKE